MSALDESKDEYPYYVCPICGMTVEKEPPERCPVCGAKGSTFRRVD